MASSPTTSWQIDGETVVTVTDFLFLGSRITVDGDCSCKIKRHLLWKKSYDKSRQHIKKQRHYFADKGLSSQSYGFSSSYVWMWEWDHKERWAWKNWCFWTVVLNIHWKDWCWSWNSNTLATWCEELTHLKRPWCWEWLRAGGEGGDRGWDGWMASPTRWTWVWASCRTWWWTGKPSMQPSMGSQRVGYDWATELNW